MVSLQWNNIFYAKLHYSLRERFKSQAGYLKNIQRNYF